MSEKSLREVAADIKQLIDEGRANDAIPRAQALLRQYPRYLAGYALLAEAALEHGALKDAIEIFRRVLSADPESYQAHAGLAAAYAEEGELGEALWHMLRAFESEPRLREIRQQLRYLYELRDGRAPGRLQLNRAALARMYMREGLHDRAVEELVPAVAEEPDRVDLLLSLAEAQWFAGRRYEAVQSAHRILLELPYCLKANLLLGEFYAREGDIASADHYLRVTQQLDPENEWAARLFGESAYLQLVSVPVDLVGAGIARLDRPEEPRTPDWLADLSLFSTVEPAEEEVDWAAIVAYESDWRTLLATATREAIAAFVPNWRVELRRATVRAVEARPRPAVLPPVPSAEPALAPAAPHAPTPVAWREPLREATHAALGALAPRPVLTPVWKPALRLATDEALAQLAPPVPEPTPLAAEWRDQLEGATRSALEETLPAPEPAALAEAPSPAPEPPRTSEVEAPAWVEGLRVESERLRFPPFVAPPPPGTSRLARLETGPLRLGRRWIEGLRVDTELAVTAHRREEAQQRLRAAALAEEGQGANSVIEWAQELAETLKSEAGGILAAAAPAAPTWVQPLRVTTREMLAARAEGAPQEPETLVERLTEGASGLIERAQTVVGAVGRHATPVGEASAPWIATLRHDTGRLLELPGVDPAPSVGQRLAEGASTVIERAQEVAGAVRRKATDSLGALFGGAGKRDGAERADATQAAPAGVVDSTPSLADELVTPEEENALSTPTLADELRHARAAWQAGQSRDAFATYQRLFFESEAHDEALSEALGEWTTTGNAPALAYQLLGDLYRRMGRMQEAVAQYREAINRM